MNKELLSIAEVAHLLKTNVNAIRDLIKQDKIPYTLIRGDYVFDKIAIVEKFGTKCKNCPK